MLCDWLKTSCHFLNQSEVTSKPIVTNLHVFSCAEWWLLVFALSSHWLIGLSASFVIGKSSYFGFGFTTLS